MSTSSTLDGSIRSVETVSIEKDDAFHILQTTRRRAAIRYMLERDDEEEFRMRDMVEEIAAWEHDTTVARLSSEQRQRVYIALYQNHLPKLDDHDVIEYNRARGLVRPLPRIALFAPYVEDRLDVEAELTHDPDGVQDDSRVESVIGKLLG
jgi:anion-transporting  ArsA/GET3 family ATPase